MTEVQFTVVQSEGGRVSIWPSDRDIPWGWHATGFTGARAQCLEHIAQTNEAVVAQWSTS